MRRPAVLVFLLLAGCNQTTDRDAVVACRHWRSLYGDLQLKTLPGEEVRTRVRLLNELAREAQDVAVRDNARAIALQLDSGTAAQASVYANRLIAACEKHP